MLFAGGLALPGLAQSPKAIELSSEWINKNTAFEISARKNKVGTYTVFIEFTTLENASQGKTHKAIVRSDGRVLTVKKQNPDKSMRFSYSYYSIRGFKNSRLDSSFVYRLPYSEHRTEPVLVQHLYNIGHYFDRSPPRNWHSSQFLLSPGDTVFACRKGLVVEVRDGNDMLPEERTAGYHSTSNDIIVEHSDGTLARYAVFEKGSISVKEGETIYPGTPLGKAGAFSVNGNYQIRFMVYFPDLNRNYKPDDPENNSRFEWVYYNPVFMTEHGNIKLTNRKSYRAVSSPELIRIEMTKKEAKAAGF